jgi:hypothetical protein
MHMQQLSFPVHCGAIEIGGVLALCRSLILFGPCVTPRGLLACISHNNVAIHVALDILAMRHEAVAVISQELRDHDLRGLEPRIIVTFQGDADEGELDVRL